MDIEWEAQMAAILRGLIERFQRSRDGEYVGWKPQPGPEGGHPWPDQGKYGPHFQKWYAARPVILDSGHIAHRREIARRLHLRGMFYMLEWEYRDLDDPWVAKVNGKIKIAA